MAEDCIFCKIRDGEIPADILYRDDHCFVIRDIAPKAPVHLLVIPNLHIESLQGLSGDERAAIGGMYAAAATLAAAEGVDSSGYRLVVNQGRDADQTVAHLHLHVLGGRPLGDMA